MKTAKKIVIIGGTGNGLVTAQIVEDMAKAGQNISVAGFLNDHESSGSLIGGYPVLGKPSEWQGLNPEYLFVFALLTVGKMEERSERLLTLGITDDRLATLIHPTAIISNGVTIGHGSVVAAYTVFQPGSSVGKNSIVRAGANLGHDAEVGNFVDIGPNTTLCGYAKVAKGAHIAPNAVVRDSISVGEFGILSAGSVALKDIEAGTTWMGNPARRVK